MSDEFSPIRPKSVPLSHTLPETDKRSKTQKVPRLATIVIGLMIAAGVGVFLIVPNLVEKLEIDKKALLPSTPGVDPSGTRVTSREPELPPFQSLQREQARARAQEELAQFVELQLKLEQTMQVGSWGQVAFDAAKSLAPTSNLHGHFWRHDTEECSEKERRGRNPHRNPAGDRGRRRGGNYAPYD